LPAVAMDDGGQPFEGRLKTLMSNSLIGLHKCCRTDDIGM
jgi:hypothetical protein